MKRKALHRDLLLLLLVALVILGLPLGIQAYDRHLWSEQIPAGAKIFELTANTNLGWVPGDIKGYQVLDLKSPDGKPYKPILTVHRGDTVVLKLTSSDVIHGFSFKDFGIFIEDGVRPGQVKLITLKADKVGEFTFSCNIICGSQHKNMQGVLVVKA